MDDVVVRAPACDRGFDISEHVVAMPGLRPSLGEIRVVQLTDLHVGNGRTRALLDMAVTAAVELEPDLVALTGDYVDRRVADIDAAADLLGRLRARLGVWAALGNHDYYADGPRVAKALKARGIRVLMNECEEAAPGLWVAGTDDLLRGAADVRRAVAGAPEGEALVLLCHHPDGIAGVAPTRRMLVLSGHTHGGQFSFPLMPGWLVCRLHLGTRRVAGWYVQGAARQYVSRGLGVAGPFPFDRRVRCRPELAVFRLRAE